MDFLFSGEGEGDGDGKANENDNEADDGGKEKKLGFFGTPKKKLTGSLTPKGTKSASMKKSMTGTKSK